MQQYISYRNKSIDFPNQTKRDYKLENRYFKQSQWYKETQRNRARNRYMFKNMGLVKPGDGSQIHHINGNPLDNRISNLVVIRNQCAHNKAHGKKCTTKSGKIKKK